jgi:hypothetical protein
LDLLRIGTKVTRLNLVDYADGMALFFQAQHRTASEGRARLLQLARKRLEASISSMSTNFVATLQLGPHLLLCAISFLPGSRIPQGEVLREMASLSSQSKEQEECVRGAVAAFQVVIAERMEVRWHTLAWARWARALLDSVLLQRTSYSGRAAASAYYFAFDRSCNPVLEEAAEKCERALRLDASHRMARRLRAEVWYRQSGFAEEDRKRVLLGDAVQEMEVLVAEMEARYYTNPYSGNGDSRDTQRRLDASLDDAEEEFNDLDASRLLLLKLLLCKRSIQMKAWSETPTPEASNELRGLALVRTEPSLAQRI